MDAGASSYGAVGFAHDPCGLHAAAQPVGAIPVAEGGEVHTVRVSATATTAPLHTYPRYSKRAVHSHQPQSASPGTERCFVSSPAVAMPNELCCSAEAGGAPGGAAEDAHMDGILDSEELERVFESIGEAEDSGRLERVKRERQGCVAAGDQEADRRTVQALTLPHPSRRHSGAPSRNGSEKRATQIFSSLRKLAFPRTLWLQRSLGYDRKDGGRASRLRS